LSGSGDGNGAPFGDARGDESNSATLPAIPELGVLGGGVAAAGDAPFDAGAVDLPLLGV
jgi:hypothetical protein